MLVKTQILLKNHIKTAHSQLCSLCTLLFSLFCSFSTHFLPEWVGEANKQNHYLHRLKEKASMVSCQESRTEWQSSYTQGDKQFFSPQWDQRVPGRNTSRIPPTSLCPVRHIFCWLQSSCSDVYYCTSQYFKFTVFCYHVPTLKTILNLQWGRA